MTENNKRLLDEAISGISEEYTDEAAQKIEEQLNREVSDTELIVTNRKEKAKFPFFAVAAAIVTIIGISVFVGVIISNNNLLTTSGSSITENSLESEIYSDTEDDLTTEQKFRALDQDMRYDEVISLLGEPYESGGEYVKYLSYKLDGDRLAVVQFLYGDNPRIDYTYISSTIANKMDDEAEFILHRRVCNHEDDYCTHDLHYSDVLCDFVEKSKGLRHGMSIDEVLDVLGETEDIGGGATSTFITYYPDEYHAVLVEMNHGNFNGEKPDGWCWFDSAYIVSRLAQDSEILYHSTYCNHSEGKCRFNNKDYTRTEVEQLNLDRKLENLQLTETATKQDVYDYVGEPDSVEELDEDITRLIYNYDDEKIGYICFYNSIGTSPILDCSYTYNFKENKIVYITDISKSCLLKTYYDLYRENDE
ncbi:MAG: hypothetical protein J6D27_01060 [Ruminiclostridium sp.]|nr:hypothetical protein [Ruminiclostridium sp.]